MTFGAIATDVTFLRLAQSRARIAAEAAALAAAGSLQEGREVAANSANDIAGMNEGPNGPVTLITSADNGTDDLTFGHWDPGSRTFEEALLAPDTVTVRVRFSDEHPNGPVNLLFSGLLGLERANVEARATANRRPRLPVPTSTWILGTFQPHAVELRRSILEINGRLEVRSDSSDAVTVLNDSLLKATLLELNGGVNVDSDDVIRGMIRAGDDFNDPPPLPELNLEGLTTRLSLVDRPGTLTLEPGAYPQGLIGVEGQYVLQDGVYLFGNQGVALSGNASLRSENAIIVLDEGASLSINAATMIAAARTQLGDDDNPSRVAIMSLSERCELVVENQGRLTVDGMIDCRSAPFQISSSRVEVNRLAVKQLEADRESQVRVGEQTPHPIELLMVE